MANRWLSGALVGVVMANWLGTPATTQASDPAPIGRSGIVQTGYEQPPAAGNQQLPAAYQQFQAAMNPQPPGGFVGYRPNVPPPGVYVPNLTGVPPAPLPDCNYEDDDHIHFVVGFQYSYIQRQRLKKHVLAVADPELTNDSEAAPPGSPVLLTYHDLDTNFRPTYRLSVGLYHGDWMFEVAGQYTGQHTNTKRIVRPGQISSFFFNPPVGFEGTGFAGENQSFLWDNADLMDLSLTSSMTHIELNCRYFGGGNGVEVDYLIGLRFIDLPEKLSIFTDDDSFQLGPIPETMATYSVGAHNRLLGPQIGCGTNFCINDWFSWGFQVRTGLFANYAEMDVKLERGDGLIGIDGGANEWGITALADSLLHLDLNGRWWRARVGYNMFWFWGLANAQDQVDFDLANQDGRKDLNGSTFYHGLTVSLDLIF